jgi:hypothetical protein
MYPNKSKWCRRPQTKLTSQTSSISHKIHFSYISHLWI